mmetsp:Transcript_79284/g.149617  ORF Transcript_79284/g.149617 Transcript_79284/m.149617 type:complete len:297 (+) Transcript_79284:87-977(+)
MCTQSLPDVMLQSFESQNDQSRQQWAAHSKGFDDSVLTVANAAVLERSPEGSSKEKAPCDAGMKVAVKPGLQHQSGTMQPLPSLLRSLKQRSACQKAGPVGKMAAEKQPQQQQQPVTRPRANASSSSSRAVPTTKRARPVHQQPPGAATPGLPGAAESKASAPQPLPRQGRQGTPLNYRRFTSADSPDRKENCRPCRRQFHKVGREGAGTPSAPGSPNPFHKTMQEAGRSNGLRSPGRSSQPMLDAQKTSTPRPSTPRHLGVIDLVPIHIDLVEGSGTGGAEVDGDAALSGSFRYV